MAVGSAGVLLSRTFQLSGDVYLAMQARGFRGEVHLLDDFAMKRLDWLALAGLRRWPRRPCGGPMMLFDNTHLTYR